MTRNRIVSGIVALALLAVPAVAGAHRSGDHHGRHHAKKHHVKKAHTREVAGTVSSFTGGELTITLVSGKSYTGTVTARTILKCVTAAPQSTTARASRHGDDDPADHDAADDGARKDDADHHDGKGDVNGNGRCTTAALTAGTNVTKAKLSLKTSGATWKKVELLK